jgi:alkylhydroperoxidase/carboxymuconolactone decarboxylase family protein YurZ
VPRTSKACHTTSVSLSRARKGELVDTPSEIQDDEQKELRDRFIRERGYWNPFWDGLLQLDRPFFEAYLNFSAVPWRSGVLEPKMKELIYIAIDAATTHLYEPGLRQHIRNAIGYGASKEEIMEVLELVSVLGIHACTLGVPILLEEYARRAEGD